MNSLVTEKEINPSQLSFELGSMVRTLGVEGGVRVSSDASFEDLTRAVSAHEADPDWGLAWVSEAEDGDAGIFALVEDLRNQIVEQRSLLDALVASGGSE